MKGKKEHEGPKKWFCPFCGASGDGEREACPNCGNIVRSYTETW